jgi:uncharacterized damage-inducible protein DinB
MSNADYFPVIRKLAEYEVWCNARVFASAATLEPAQLHQQFPFGLHTIHETLWHILAVIRRWSSHIGPKIVDPPWPDYDSTMSLDALTRWNDELSRTFLDAIDQSHSARLLHHDRRIVHMFHLITHGTHHRTQYITMLRLLGKDPPFEAGDFGGWENPKNNRG